MILTIKEARTFQDIKGYDKDETIAALLPVVEDFALNRLNNYFNLPDLKLTDSEVVFTPKADQSTPAQITITEGDFNDISLRDNGHVYIIGSRHNDGIKRIGTVAEKVLTLHVDEDLFAEDSAEEYSVTFFFVQIPTSIKLMINRMLEYQMGNTVNATVSGVRSESIGSYSVTYDSNNAGGYPEAILALGNNYRRPHFD